MTLSFINPKLEEMVNESPDAPKSKLCKLIKKRRADCTAEDILQTINVLEAAPTCADIPYFYHPHPLTGNMEGLFSIDITARGRGKHRIIFKPAHDNDPSFRIDTPTTITRIVITDICKNYHHH